MNPDLQEVVAQHDKEIKEIKSAFPATEKGDPDYAVHKKDHEERKEDKETRGKILSDVSTWAVVGIMVLMLSHFVQNIKDFLGAIGK